MWHTSKYRYSDKKALHRYDGAKELSAQFIMWQTTSAKRAALCRDPTLSRPG